MNKQDSEQDALDLRAYLRPIARRKWMVIAIVIIATAATYEISSRQPKTYVASTSLYIQAADPTRGLAGTTPTPNDVTSSSVADVAQLMLAAPITRAVTAQLHMPASLAGSVTATPANGSDFVTLTATSHRPRLAARLANTYISAFLRSRQDAVTAQALKDERAAQSSLSSYPASSKNVNDVTQRATVLGEIGTFKQIASNPSAGAQQVSKAIAPTVPSSPQPKRDAIFGAVVGLVLALIAAFCLELLDRRVQSAGTVESVFGRPVLAVLPHVPDPTPMIDGSPVVPAQFVEELRSLTVMLRMSSADPPRTIMISSTLPREGKSTVARDLALVYATGGKRVLAIDSDLRRPSLKVLFGTEPSSGLVQILRGEASLSEAAVTAVGTRQRAKVSTNGSGEARLDALIRGAPVEPPPTWEPGSVDVLAHGERLDNPLALLSSERMWSLLQDAARAYDIVIVDTPPVLTVADCVPMMEVADCVLLVARLGQTTRRSGERLQDLVTRLSHVNFIGVIANDRRGQSDEDGYGYYGYYGSDYGSDVQPESREPKSQTPTTSS